MERREFLRTIETSAVIGAGSLLAVGNRTESAEVGTAGQRYRFRLGMYLPELGLPFDKSLATAKQLGAEAVWFNGVPGAPDIAKMTDAQARRIAAQVKSHDLEIFLLNAGNPFKKIHLAELDIKTMAGHPAFRRDLDALVRSMQIAREIGVSAVGSFTFAWPGEYTAGKPTWPMRWLTRGGVIARVDQDKWLKAFSMVADQAEKYGVDVALSMMPWNYTNTTGNFRRLVERLGSHRLKVMWGPADNVNCGEWDTATAGFQNVRPYLHGLHIKDLRVNNGLELDFDYCPFGEGDVDYRTVLTNLRDHRCDVVLSVSTHFRPNNGDQLDAMKINVANIRKMIGQIETAG